MAKESTRDKVLLETLKKLPEELSRIIIPFLDGYREAVGKRYEETIPNILLFLDLVLSQAKQPYAFEPYHQKIRHPIDYYKFGCDFIRPLIDLPKSTVSGLEHLESKDKKRNVILLANHQTETDPQAISILLEKTHPRLAEKIIYVAGERVVTDPLAIPFSMGCDLLCIYSKRYIDYPPELKAKKQLHNKNTMELMSRLLQEGGKVIYVAPSGGRDRKNPKGIVEVAPFDPASIEMFYLMAKKAKTPTVFVPLALSTYDLLPPPETIQKELGEARSAQHSRVHLAFSAPFDMDHFPGSEETDKVLRRQNRANAIWHIVNTNYTQFARLL
jgi:glycerol-3-phosphate O-acyltransferase